MIFDIVALVCALGQPPQECQSPTARIVAKVGEARSEMSCASRSQWDAAKLPSIGDDEYVKIQCVKRDD
jgi:hypothetical protein